MLEPAANSLWHAPLELLRALCSRCGSSLHRHGSDRGRLRYRCPLCHKVYVDRPTRFRNGNAIGREWINSAGRACIYLGPNHPCANSGGWQYLSRYLVYRHLNRPLLTSEQVDHVNKDRTDDRIQNLRVLISLYSPKDRWNHHNWQRGGTAVVAEWDQENGRFVEYDEPRMLYGH